MKFDDFDKKMRVYEKSIDQYITPGTYIIARLDGRGFTKLTHGICKFEVPFDIKFRDMMVNTTKHLIDCGFKIIYGYTESDEISLLFSQKDKTFAHKVRKLNTILAGEASGYFSLKVGLPVCFDCRIVPLPNFDLVKDYFLWRETDASRNALNGWCYWTLRKEGKSKGEATSYLLGKSVAFKNELLFSMGINYNDVPSWQKRGIGIYNVLMDVEGRNPLTGEVVNVKRNRLHIDYELALGKDYVDFLEWFLNK